MVENDTKVPAPVAEIEADAAVPRSLPAFANVIVPSLVIDEPVLLTEVCEM